MVLWEWFRMWVVLEVTIPTGNHGSNSRSNVPAGSGQACMTAAMNHGESSCLDMSGPPGSGSDTLNADAKVSSPSQEKSGQSGTTLREHDYIGLSEVSSSARTLDNSRSAMHAERVQGVELNLNLSATELRLGPPAALRACRNLKEGDNGSSFSACNAGFRLQELGSNALESGGHPASGGASCQDQNTSASEADAGSNYENVSADEELDRGFSAYNNGAHIPSERAGSPKTNEGAESGACRPFLTSDTLQNLHGEPAKERPGMTECLSLGIGLVSPGDKMPEDNLFHNQERVCVEEKRQIQQDKQQPPPSQEISCPKERTWPDRHQSNGVVQQEVSGEKPPERALYGRRLQDQPGSMERPKQERVIQEGSLSERVPQDVQGLRGGLVDSAQAAQAVSSGAHGAMPCLRPPQLSQSGPETRYSQESPGSRYTQDSLLAGLDRSPILQEFSVAQKLYYAQHSQMMKAAAEAKRVGMAAPDHPMPQTSQEHEGGQRSAFSHGSFPLSRIPFPGAKNGGVAGAKRGFSEAIGSPPSEARNGGFPEGRSGFVEGVVGMPGASREGPSGSNVAANGGSIGDEPVDVKTMSQQAKHQPGTPPTSVYPWGPKLQSWQQINLEHSRGPFPSQRPMRGQMLTKPGEVGADLRPKAQQESGSLNMPPSDTNKHGAAESRPPVAKDAATAAPPRVVGWPPVRPFRKNTFGRAAAQASFSGSPTKDSPTYISSSDYSSPCSYCEREHPIISTSNSRFVKVYMDGVPIGRKVDLKTNSSYEKLSGALEDMFQYLFNGQHGGPQGSSVGESGNTLSGINRKLNLGSEFVLTYEDQEGDLMLVGDVPWQMFISTVKRLRIMKGSEAVGLAPRGGDKMVKTQALVA